jgi:hypothetical protein
MDSTGAKRNLMLEKIIYPLYTSPNVQSQRVPSHRELKVKKAQKIDK